MMKRVLTFTTLIIVVLSCFSSYILYNFGYEKGYIEGLNDLEEHGYYLRDPMFTEVLIFTFSDSTDEHEYVSGNYTCVDFANDFKHNAFEHGFRCGLVTIKFESGLSHRINVFNTTDYGLIFVEPQTDEIMFSLKIGERYWNGRAGYNDTIVSYEVNWDE